MQYKIYKYQYIRDLAEIIRNTYKENGITINPTSSLEETLDAAEELARAWEDKDKSITADEERFLKILRLSLTCLYLGEAINYVKTKTGLRTKLKKLLKDTLDPSERKVSEARNFAFELYLAGKLESKGIHTSFVEPDIHFRLLSHELVLACKHPFSLRNIGKLIKKAKRQIARSNFKGFIGLAIDQLVKHPGGVVVKDEADWGCYAEYQFREFSSQNEAIIMRKLNRSPVIGLIISLNNPIISKKDNRPVLGQQLWVWSLNPAGSVNYEIAKKLNDTLNYSFTPEGQT